jgi:hypothetical protein
MKLTCVVRESARYWQAYGQGKTEGGTMSISFVHSKGADAPITIPAIGLDLFVRMAPAASGGAFSIIETINAPGKGPPRHGIGSRRSFAFSKTATFMRWTAAVSLPRPAMWSAFPAGPNTDS